VDLAKIRLEPQRCSARQHRGRLERAPRRTRHHEVDDLTGERGSRAPHLVAAARRERRVAAADQALARVGVGIAVSNQYQASQRTHGVLLGTRAA
jgi:hypothetical protein